MIFKNIAVKWASILEPNTTFDPMYEVCLYPSADQLEQFVKAGLTMKQDKEDGSPFYRASSRVKTKSGKLLTPPRVVDMKKAPVTDLVGNGSICNVILDVKDVEYMGKTSRKGYLVAVQVVKLVVYVGSEDFDDVAEGEEDF